MKKDYCKQNWDQGFGNSKHIAPMQILPINVLLLQFPKPVFHSLWSHKENSYLATTATRKKALSVIIEKGAFGKRSINQTSCATMAELYVNATAGLRIRETTWVIIK